MLAFTSGVYRAARLDPPVLVQAPGLGRLPFGRTGGPRENKEGRRFPTLLRCPGVSRLIDVRAYKACRPDWQAAHRRHDLQHAYRPRILCGIPAAPQHLWSIHQICLLAVFTANGSNRLDAMAHFQGVGIMESQRKRSDDRMDPAEQ